MTERYEPSSFDNLYDYSEFAIDDAPIGIFEQPKQVDMTKKPRTPREASDQSGVYVSQLEDLELKLDNEAMILKLSKEQANTYLLNNAETMRKLIATWCNELIEIRQTEDPDVQRTLWEDVIDLSSKIQQPNYVYGIYEKVYTVKDSLVGFIEKDYVTSIVRDAGEDAYLTKDGFQKDPIDVWTMVRKIVEFGLEENSSFSTEDAYNKLLETRFSRIFEYPDYNVLSPDMWQKISDTVKYTKELKNHVQGDSISQGLSDFLTATADKLLSKQQENLVLADIETQKQKEYMNLEDVQIAERARAIIDEKQQPTLQEAREHAHHNITLLRRAALAEAALDGVSIRRTSPRKR